jgi:hypothetical protein
MMRKKKVVFSYQGVNIEGDWPEFAKEFSIK